MTSDLRQLAATYIPRGAVTPRETFVPLGAPIPEPTVWTTSRPEPDNTAEMDLHINHHFGGGVYTKETRLPAGYSMGKHVHRHDHLSILGSGSAMLKVDGVQREIHAPTCITVKAGKVHEVTALTDITWFCVHATEETDVARIDKVLIG